MDYENVDMELYCLYNTFVIFEMNIVLQFSAIQIVLFLEKSNENLKFE